GAAVARRAGLRAAATPVLFPYTTLFRSRIPDARCGERAARRTQGIDETPQAARGAQGGARQDREGDQGHRFGHHRVLRGGGERADRKSTRLNSSHGSTSYAAFCLKNNER